MSQKKKKRGNWTKPMCKCTWAFSPVQQIKLSPPSFLHILGKKYFGEFREKTLGLHHIFSLSSPNQTLIKKFSSPLFSPQFSILSKIPPNKHTLRDFKNCLKCPCQTIA